MKRILYHHRTMGRGGEGLHISSVVTALRSLGHKIIMVAPPGIGGHVEEQPVDKTVTSETGLRLIWKGVSKRLPQWLFEIFEICYNFWSLARLHQNVKLGVDLLYERSAFFLFAGAYVSSSKGIPFFLEVNEVSGFKRARGQCFKWLTERIERWVFEKADAVFAVSSKLGEEVRKRGVPPEKIFLTPNAIDPDRFAIEKSAINRVRDALGLNGCVVMGFVGWFDDWDNLGDLVERFSEVHSRYPHTRLLLVGDGPATSNLRKRIATLGLQDCVMLTGAVKREDVPTYIGAMDVCLIPDSNVFGSPIVLFEYMGMAKPILAPDLQPIRDVICHSVNGLIFERLAHESFEVCLVALITDPDLRIRLGQSAYASVMRRHTWTENARRIIDVYNLRTKGNFRGMATQQTDRH